MSSQLDGKLRSMAGIDSLASKEIASKLLEALMKRVSGVGARRSEDCSILPGYVHLNRVKAPNDQSNAWFVELSFSNKMPA